MKDHYALLLRKAEIPKEASLYLQDVGDRVLNANTRQVEQAITAYLGGQLGIEAAANQLHPLAAAFNIPIRTIDYIFVACASARLREMYRQDGLADTLFWDTIADVRCKLIECHTVYNEWGLDCLPWYDIFFKRDLFWLGRLQYERLHTMPEPSPVQVGKYWIRPGDPLYSIHIPSSGPLTRENRWESYQKAYAFFEKERNGKPLYCCCLSWLLFPDNRRIFPPHLNLIHFMDDFKIVDAQPNDFHDLWRVFGRPFEGDFSVLPRDNTMRRALGDWLDNGGKTGYGVGYFVFDGQHLITD